MLSAVVTRCIVAVCPVLILPIGNCCVFCIFDFLYIFGLVLCRRLFFRNSFFFQILLTFCIFFCIFRLLFIRWLVYTRLLTVVVILPLLYRLYLLLVLAVLPGAFCGAC